MREVDVVIVGAGPAGLTMALHLGQAGIRTLVVERRGSLSRHPKANGVFSRTMEIYRQYGLAGTIRDGALPAERSLGFAWMTRLNGIEMGSIMFAKDADEYQNVYSVHSPEMPAFTPQDKLERMVADACEALASVDIAYETSAIGLGQDDDGVVTTLRRNDGTEYQVRSRYLIGADGTRSVVRPLAGITETAGQPWGGLLTIYFESAEWERLKGDRPYQLLYMVNAESRGAAWPVSYENRWLFSPEQVPGMGKEDYTDEVCADLISKAAGQPVATKILNVNLWQIEQAIADRWRERRVFLVGDAAHRFPPHGGYGMNSGVQDSHNLAWKLAMVLKGTASDALLDSYEDERKPVADWNAEQTVRNTEHMAEVDWGQTNNEQQLATIDDPVLGQAARDRIAAAIPLQRESVHSQGQQFGAIYESDAIAADGTPPPRSSVSDYRESGAPGARAPHLWVSGRQGERISLLDLFKPDRFTLLVNGEDAAWRDAAEASAAATGIAIDCHAIGGERAGYRETFDYRPETFADLYGVAAGGAILVRPDGYVGWRGRDGEQAALMGVTLRLLSRGGGADRAVVQDRSGVLVP